VRQHADRKALHLLALLFERVSEPQHEGQLGHFGRLDVDGTNRQPARGAATGVTKANDAQHHEHGDDAQDRISELLVVVVVDVRQHQHERERSAGVHGLALQEILGVTEHHRRFDDAGAVDHDDTETEQGNDDRGKRDVHPPALTRRRLGECAQKAHESSCFSDKAAAANWSPRSA